MDDKHFSDKIRPDTDDLDDLRMRVERINMFFKRVFGFHIFCAVVFILLLFKAVYGIGIGNAFTPIMIGIAALIAIIPLIALCVMAFCKNKAAIITLIIAMSGLFLLCFALSCKHEFTIIFILAPIYLTALCSLLYKNSKVCFCVCALAMILYCILSLVNDIGSVNYPHILLLLSVILNSISLKKHREYTELSKIYGFPYFIERFNEQKSEYIPQYSTGDFVGNTPDNVDIDGRNESDTLLKPYTSEQPNTMQSVDCDIDIDTVCDVPLTNSSEVEAYTQKLRELKNKKR